MQSLFVCVCVFAIVSDLPTECEEKQFFECFPVEVCRKGNCAQEKERQCVSEERERDGGGGEVAGQRALS